MYEHQLTISAANSLIETFKHLVEFGRHTFLQPRQRARITDYSIPLGKTKATSCYRSVEIENYDSIEIAEEHFGLAGSKRIDVEIWGDDEVDNPCMLGLYLDGGKCLSTDAHRIEVLLSTNCENLCPEDHDRCLNYEFLPLGTELITERKNALFDLAYLKMLWLFGEVVAAAQGKFGCQDLRVAVGNWIKPSSKQMWFSNCQEPFVQEWRREQLNEYTDVHYTSTFPTIDIEKYEKLIVQRTKHSVPNIPPELLLGESSRNALSSYAGHAHQGVHINFFDQFPVLIAPRKGTIGSVLEAIWTNQFVPRS